MENDVSEVGHRKALLEKHEKWRTRHPAVEVRGTQLSKRRKAGAASGG
jgi:hypothetical protein